jgi:type IV secretion system protein VirB6
MRFVVIILTLFCLSGCMDAQCIDADDFGFAKFTVSAKQDKKNIFGDVDNQVSKWSNTGYSLTGDPLVIVVKNWNYKDNGNVGRYIICLVPVVW